MGIIYKLNFDSGDFYIGQTSKTIAARITQHRATKGKGCPLLEFAFQNHKFIGYDVLEETSSDQLDNREQHWIGELKPTLNTTPGGRSTAGLSHPKLKYSKEQIEQAVNLFLNTNLTYKEISDQTGVGYGMVHDITKRRAHAWAWENYLPETFETAKKLRKPSFRLYDADNQEYEADTLKQLAEQLQEPLHAVHSALDGRQSKRGLSLVKHPKVLLTDPQLEQFELTLPRAKEFLEACENLSKFQRDQLLVKHRPSGGWQVKLLE